MNQVSEGSCPFLSLSKNSWSNLIQYFSLWVDKAICTFIYYLYSVMEGWYSWMQRSTLYLLKGIVSIKSFQYFWTQGSILKITYFQRSTSSYQPNKQTNPEVHTELPNYLYFNWTWASLVAQMVKNLPAMRETWVQSLGLEDPLPEEGNGCPLPVFWPGEFYGLYSPWRCKESDTRLSDLPFH